VKRWDIGLAVLVVLLGATQVNGMVAVYSNGFEGLVGSEWSKTTTSATPIGARGSLGEFGRETVTLTLSNLPSHDSITVSYDLFVIRSWDGNNGGGLTPPFGPDVWSLGLGGGPELFTTSFGNFGAPINVQSFPDSYPDGNHPHRTGASEVNTLGYVYANAWPMDTVYELTSTFGHTANHLELLFTAVLRESMEDVRDNESWGLDNVQVSIHAVPEPEIIPEPSTLIIWSLLGTLAITVGWWRRRRAA